MSYMVMMNPAIRMDIMVAKEYQTQLVSYMYRMGCSYREERESTVRGKQYVCLKDISGKGKGIGEMIGLFYSLEWGHLVEGIEEDKFYILLNLRKKNKGVKKHVRENRKETDTGSESGDRGEPAPVAGSEPLDGPAGNGIDAGDTGADDLWEQPRM